MISFHSLPSRVSSSPPVVLLYLAFLPTHHSSISSSFLQFHLMMRRTEMMNDFRIRVVNYIHIRTLRHPGNHISSHADTILVRAPNERNSVTIPMSGEEVRYPRRESRWGGNPP